MPNILERGIRLVKKIREKLTPEYEPVLTAIAETQHFNQSFSRIQHDFELFPQEDESVRIFNVLFKSIDGTIKPFWICSTGASNHFYLIDPSVCVRSFPELELSRIDTSILLPKHVDSMTLYEIQIKLENQLGPDFITERCTFEKVKIGEIIPNQECDSLRHLRFAV